MKKIKLIIILFIVSCKGYTQSKELADKYFKDYAYKDAAELYLDEYNEGNVTVEILRKLGDCYYFNLETEEAEKWYRLLFEKFESSVEPEYFFRYSQVLKSNGKQKESDEWLLKLKSKKPNDTRVIALEDNKNYYEEIISKKGDVYKKLHNLSSNTNFSDFGGYILGNEFYFASTRPFPKKTHSLYGWNNQPFLNIYRGVIDLDQKNEILEVSHIKDLKSINSKYHESNVVITKDGLTMYFTRDNHDGKKLKGDKENISHLKLYRAKRKNDDTGDWGDIVELPFNSNEYSCGHPTLSKDEKTLYFVSDMPNGLGETDIYEVKILENEKFGQPVNMGRAINTEGREMFPFISNDSTLYFSSDGHLGLGALDVFKSQFKKGVYTKAENIGEPINSPLDDFYFVLNDDNKSGFFSSNRKGGKGDDDIYSFFVDRKCVKNIEGIVINEKNKEPIENATVKLIDSSNKLVLKEVKTNDKGKYIFKYINCLDKYAIIISHSHYKSKTVEVKRKEKNIKIADVVLTPIIEGNKILVNPIYFRYGSSAITARGAYELDKVVAVLEDNPGMVIKIESHTDSRGSRRGNLRLSDRRAKSTRRYILSKGVEPYQIQSAIGYGESRLLIDCQNLTRRKCTEEDYSINRRSNFFIVKRGFNKENLTNNKDIKVNRQSRETNRVQKYYGNRYYRVKKGDTLYSIFKRTGVPVYKLKEINNLFSNEIHVGQRIYY